ncbi:MAG TPA: hypothetical protein DDX98_09260 [Bacteroidales bacterium]|jgi:hypothetical protein|nr:hypothetical protein [Bacteroidales bacterium]
MAKTNIIVNLQYEAIHHWPGCDIPEVSFLKDKHRHIFHICCKREVQHDDRDIEIIMFKRKILKFLQSNYNGDFGSMSCEMIANELAYIFKLSYCSVLEDGENGAEIEI